jgi:uncharacterized damage-inducible protein DinB
MTMSLSDAMVQELQYECAITKKLLERIPEDKLEWKPHDKSMPLGRLATHITEIPQWAGIIVEQGELDMANIDFQPTILGSRVDLLDSLQKNLDKFEEVMKGKDDQALSENWRLRHGDKVIFDLPKVAVLRSSVLNHIVHHRGQLSVYLRENDVPVPAIYGPSADEQG